MVILDFELKHIDLAFDFHVCKHQRKHRKHGAKLRVLIKVKNISGISWEFKGTPLMSPRQEIRPYSGLIKGSLHHGGK